MAHSLCTSEAGEELSHFQRLWRTLFDPDTDPGTKFERLFERETTEFDLNYAFLSRISVANATERFETVHGSHEVLQPGATVPLSETYCRKTITEPGGTLAVSDAPAEGWADDPAYDTFGLGSYLGTTVSVEDELYGTLCFANTTPRDDPIRETEKTLVEMYGQWAAYTLDPPDGPATRETRIDAVEDRAASSEAIDSMMAALENRTRRVILTTLGGDVTEISISTLERRIDRENTRIRLRHNHLPRLATAGYITWDDGSDTIARGPNFPEVEPLVQFLNEYDTGAPE